MKYDDLLLVPYKAYGRDIKTGLDCYGLTLELCKRNGKVLPEFPYESSSIAPAKLKECESIIKAHQIKRDDVTQGDLIEYFSKDGLHIAYCLSHKTVIHMTYSGVRVSLIDAFKNALFFRIDD